MKRFFLLLLLFTAFGACIALHDVPRKAEKGPPGTIFLRDSLYIDVSEVKNIDWLEYLYWLNTKYGRNYPEIEEKALPDSLVWRDRLSYGEPYVESYFRHPAYRDYPVVGITYRQAKDYCLWRTERVRENIKNNPKESKKWAGLTITYRLPSEAEWMYAAAAGRDTTKFPFGYEEPVDRRYNKPKYRLALPNSPYTFVLPEECVMSTKDGMPNSYGLYNIIGNVAEMTLTEGVAKGGSFMHTPDEARISQSQTYTDASKWLGFRCVCVVQKSE